MKRSFIILFLNLVCISQTVYAGSECQNINLSGRTWKWEEAEYLIGHTNERITIRKSGDPIPIFSIDLNGNPQTIETGLLLELLKKSIPPSFVIESPTVSAQFESFTPPEQSEPKDKEGEMEEKQQPPLGCRLMIRLRVRANPVQTKVSQLIPSLEFGPQWIGLMYADEKGEVRDSPFISKIEFLLSQNEEVATESDQFVEDLKALIRERIGSQFQPYSKIHLERPDVDGAEPKQPREVSLSCPLDRVFRYVQRRDRQFRVDRDGFALEELVVLYYDNSIFFRDRNGRNHSLPLVPEKR